MLSYANGVVCPGFLAYAAAVLLLCGVLVVFFSPRVGRSNIFVYVGICSLLGAFTVSSVKGLAIAAHTGETTEEELTFHRLSPLTL